MTIKELFAKFTHQSVTSYHRKDRSAWLTVAQGDEGAELVIEGAIGESFYDESGVSSSQYRKALAAIPKNKENQARDPLLPAYFGKSSEKGAPASREFAKIGETRLETGAKTAYDLGGWRR